MVTCRLLETRDIEAFLNWRGGDEYLNRVLWDAIGEHLKGKRFVFLALSSDDIIGTVTLVTQHSDPDLADGNETVYIEALEIKESHRRQSVATQLMSSLQKLALEHQFTRLTVMVEPWNKAALHFFSRVGFQEYRNSVFCWRGQECRVVCLEKSLRELTV